MDKFILAANQMHPEQSGCFIIHMIDPIAIIGCLEGHVGVDKHPFRHYSFKNCDGVTELWTLYAYHLFTTNMNNVDDQVAEATVDHLLNRAWRWYRAYMEWEDQQE